MSRPNTVSYICTFRGADTATFIKLKFQVTYKPELVPAGWSPPR